MTTLIASLSTGKGTWTEVIKLIKAEEWDKIILVTNEFGKEKFSSPKPAEMIVINTELPEQQLADIILSELKEKVEGTEIAINITSGSGKEHMALLSAVLKAGLGLRIVTVENDQLKIL